MDYYRILEIEQDAGRSQVRQAYLRLVSETHPDRLIDNSLEIDDRFKKIQEAFEVLSDPDRRAEYDRTQLRSPVHFRQTVVTPRAGAAAPAGRRRRRRDTPADWYDRSSSPSIPWRVLVIGGLLLLTLGFFVVQWQRRYSTSLLQAQAIESQQLAVSQAIDRVAAANAGMLEAAGNTQDRDDADGESTQSLDPSEAGDSDGSPVENVSQQKIGSPSRNARSESQPSRESQSSHDAKNIEPSEEAADETTATSSKADVAARQSSKQVRTKTRPARTESGVVTLFKDIVKPHHQFFDFGNSLPLPQDPFIRTDFSHSEVLSPVDLIPLQRAIPDERFPTPELDMSRDLVPLPLPLPLNASTVPPILMPSPVILPPMPSDPITRGLMRLDLVEISPPLPKPHESHSRHSSATSYQTNSFSSMGAGSNTSVPAQAFSANPTWKSGERESSSYQQGRVDGHYNWQHHAAPEAAGKFREPAKSFDVQRQLQLRGDPFHNAVQGSQVQPANLNVPRRTGFPFSGPTVQ